MMVRVVGAKCQHCGNSFSGHPRHGNFPFVVSAERARELSQLKVKEHGVKGVLLELEPV